MRKSPEKWSKWTVGAALANHPVQLSILRRALRLLAPGGKLVYSTCSLNPIEDEAVVAAALLTAREVRVLTLTLTPALTLTSRAPSDTFYTWLLLSQEGTQVQLASPLSDAPAAAAALRWSPGVCHWKVPHPPGLGSGLGLA